MWTHPIRSSPRERRSPNSSTLLVAERHPIPWAKMTPLPATVPRSCILPRWMAHSMSCHLAGNAEGAKLDAGTSLVVNTARHTLLLTCRHLPGFLEPMLSRFHFALVWLLVDQKSLFLTTICLFSQALAQTLTHTPIGTRMEKFGGMARANPTDPLTETGPLARLGAL
ncbi:hypothetical protein VTK56DRAFT_2358 [Thermocarpiscus australiensis]